MASSTVFLTSESRTARCKAVRLVNHPFRLTLFSSGLHEVSSGVFPLLPNGAQGFIQSMERFEHQTFLTYSSDTQLLREAIGVGLPSSTPLAPRLVLQHYMLSNAITAYRLVEELLLMSEVPSSSEAPPVPKHPTGVEMKHLVRLNNLSALVEDFSKAINAIPPSFQPAKLANAGPLTHLMALIELKQVKNSANILTNLTVAALHLGYLLESPCHGELPDLPDTPDKYMAAMKLLDGSGAITPEQLSNSADFLARIYFSENHGPNLRSPLQLTLMVSSLCLLIPIDLHSKRWNRREINEIASSLGNIRPTEIFKMERLVFTAIYRVALREIDVTTAALALSKALSDLIHEDDFQTSNIQGWFNFMSTAVIDHPTQDVECVHFHTSHPYSAQPRPDRELSPIPPEKGVCQETSTGDAQIVDGPHVIVGRPNQKDSGVLAGVDRDDDSDPSDVDMEQADEGQNGIRAALPHSFDRGQSNVNEDIRQGESGDEERNGDDEVAARQDKVRDNQMELETALGANDGGSDPGAVAKGKRKRITSWDNGDKSGGLAGERRSERLQKSIQSLSYKNTTSTATHPFKRLNTRPKPVVNTVDPEVIVIDFNSDSETDIPKESTQTQLTLIPKSTIHRSERVYTLYGPTEQDMISYSPIAHSKGELKIQESYLDAVLESYVDGKPLHLANPCKSAFRPLTESVFNSTPIRDIQNIFSYQNIIVHDIPQKGLVKFDEEGFYKLVPSLHEKIDIQDQSIPPKNGDFHVRVKKGTPRQLLEAHRQENGKILNALNFPGTHLTYHDFPLSSDLAAWEATFWRKMSENEEFPVRHMRWFLAATKGASHNWHIDANGTATIIATYNGPKIWIVAHRDDWKTEQSFAQIDFFLPPGFDITEPCKQKWRLEAVILLPGSQLAMRPNTTHAVITTDSAICWGGHFFCISTMQLTAASIMHSFTIGTLITNTNHDETRTLLRRMAELCYLVLVRNKLCDNMRMLQHVPELDRIDGILNLLSLCNLVIFANVLDGRTYQGWNQETTKRTAKQSRDMKVYDRNALSFEDREKYRHARGMCLQVLLWFAASFEVTAEDSCGGLAQVDVLDYLVFGYLVQQGRALLAYRLEANKHGAGGFPGCTLNELSLQLDSLFKINVKLNERWVLSAQDQDKETYRNLLWSGRRDLTFKRKDGAILSGEFKIVDFSDSGTTALDRRFLEGYTIGFSDR